MRGPDDPSDSDDDNTTPQKMARGASAAESTLTKDPPSEEYTSTLYHRNNRRVFYSNLALVGPVNAGKTSLVDSLFGLPFNAASINCVDPLECSVSTIYASTSAEQWERHESPLHARIRQHLADVILSGRIGEKGVDLQVLLHQVVMQFYRG